MSMSTLLILFLVAVVVSIVINYKTGINLGIPALIFAYVIGCWLLKMRVKEVVACWPTSTLFQMMMITMFFSFGVFNGTMNKLAMIMLYKMRKIPSLLPFVLFVIGTIIGILGAPPPAVCTIMSVLTFSLARPAGLNPWLCLIVTALGGSTGTFFPWAVQGSVIKTTTEGMIEGMGERVGYSAAVGYFIFMVIMLLIYWIITKGYKLKPVEMEKPEPMDPKQRTTLTIIIIVALLAIIPNFLKLLMPTSAFIKTISGPLDIQMLAVVGTFVCGILKLGDVKDAITKGIPWNTVFLIAGICTLINVVSSAGLTEWLGAQLKDSVSPSIIIVIFALLAAFMSLFAGAINAVFPMLAAIAVPYAAAAGISASPMLVAIAVGASATAVSPFSTGGSLAIANCTDETMRDGLFMKEIILAVTGAVLCAILGLVGVFNI